MILSAPLPDKLSAPKKEFIKEKKRGGGGDNKARECWHQLPNLAASKEIVCVINGHESVVLIFGFKTRIDVKRKTILNA